MDYLCLTRLVHYCQHTTTNRCARKDGAHCQRECCSATHALVIVCECALKVAAREFLHAVTVPTQMSSSDFCTRVVLWVVPIERSIATHANAVVMRVDQLVRKCSPKLWQFAYPVLANNNLRSKKVATGGKKLMQMSGALPFIRAHMNITMPPYSQHLKSIPGPSIHKARMKYCLR